MSLIKCPECGKEISDSAEKCPNCGYPIGTYNGNVFPNNMNAPINNDSYPNQPIIVQQHNPKKGNSALGIVALILSILGCTFVIGAILAIIDLRKKDEKKKTCSAIALGICGFWLVAIIIASGSSSEDTSQETIDIESTQVSSIEPETTVDKDDNIDQPVEKSTTEPEEKDKYFVGDSWQNKYIKVIYTDCYEFTDYNQYNAPADGCKIICAEFEFENIGNSDSTVMYTDFHGYADGYEVDQSYAPDGTGLEFIVKMSAGRKGTGKVAFEVSEDAQEIEIEFSPNMWTSENIVFVYQ